MIQLQCNNEDIFTSKENILYSSLLSTFDLTQPIRVEFPSEIIKQILELYQLTNGKLPSYSCPLKSEKFEDNISEDNKQLILEFFKNHTPNTIFPYWKACANLRFDKLSDIIITFLATYINGLKTPNTVSMEGINHINIKYAWLWNTRDENIML